MWLQTRMTCFREQSTIEFSVLSQLKFVKLFKGKFDYQILDHHSQILLAPQIFLIIDGFNKFDLTSEQKTRVTCLSGVVIRLIE